MLASALLSVNMREMSDCDSFYSNYSLQFFFSRCCGEQCWVSYLTAIVWGLGLCLI